MAQSTSPGKVIFPAEVSRLRRAWTYTTGDAIESSPVVAGAVVYIGSQDHHIYALDASTGEKLWCLYR
jgi:outer membrane protein assembly factor BamB